MRFMVIVKASKESENGQMPDKAILEAMGKYNEELVKAGVMLAGEGLAPSSKGCRMKFEGKKRTVTDGPFAETKEQLGGFFLIDARDLNEALLIASRIPPARIGSIEVRAVRNLLDYVDRAQRRSTNHAS